MSTRKANPNRGKKFEDAIKKSFAQVPDVSIDRVKDTQSKFRGDKNICDFVVYKKPFMYYIECKSVHGPSIPFTNITETQWDGLLEKSRIDGVIAGIMVWFIDKDVTKFIPIDCFQWNKEYGFKSLRYDHNGTDFIVIQGKKKRVYFEYDMKKFFEEAEDKYEYL